MDRLSFPKVLDEIKQAREQEEFSRALTLVDDLLSKGTDTAEVHAEGIGIATVTESWRQVLNRLLAGLAKHRLSMLCKDKNRVSFLRLVHEYSGFRNGLTDFFLNNARYDGFHDWIALSDKQAQQWLIKHWHKLAQEETKEDRSGRLLVATGIGLFVMGDGDGAVRQWSLAIGKDSSLLQKITQLYKASPRVDMRQPAHRLRLIQLIAASGKLKEAMTLLQALGLENERNAHYILKEMANILPVRVYERETALLRFNLAMGLSSPDPLYQVIGEWKEMSEEDIFFFKKQIRTRIQEKRPRMAALLEMVKLHVKREDWENAAALLEALHAEDVRPEIIALMEHVIDHYPILSNLNYLVGKFYLERGDGGKAANYLSVISDVKEYRNRLCPLLEDHLAKKHSVALARLLFSVLPPFSHKAALVALMLILRGEEDGETVLAQLETWNHRKTPSPFWYLAMIYGSIKRGDLVKVSELVPKLLLDYAGLAPEVLRVVEHLADGPPQDHDALVKFLHSFRNALEPVGAWSLVRERLERQSKAFKSAGESSEKENQAAANETKLAESPKTSTGERELNTEDLDDTGEENPPKTEPPRLKPAASAQVTEALQAGKAAPGSRKKTKADPPKVKNEANVRVVPETAREAGKPEAKPASSESSPQVPNLLKKQEWTKALEQAQAALEGHVGDADAPMLHQAVGLAQEGLGKQHEAMTSFCKASINPDLYQENRHRFLDAKPSDPRFQDILHVVLEHKDRDTWTTLMRNWHKEDPGQLTALIRSQNKFTRRVDSPISWLDLALWYLEAGQVKDIDGILSAIDLSDEKIRASLIQVADLAAIKYPGDPKPKIVLGRYYLFHHEVSKAVNLFRDLVKHMPTTARPVFKLVRTYLRKDLSSVDTRYLYGLLIRFSLAHGSAHMAIRLLEEYGKQNREEAVSLVDGVLRVLRRKQALEDIYHLARLMWQWGKHDRVLHIHDLGLLGSNMADERLNWLEEIASGTELRDHALLCMGQLYFDLADFQACRNRLGLIASHHFRRRSLKLYEKLMIRFPEDIDLWREAGWIAFSQNKHKAREIFWKIFKSERIENFVEAFAVLQEMGEKADFKQLTSVIHDEDKLFSELQTIHEHIRELELSDWCDRGGQVPIKSLEWLLFSGKLDRFRQLLPQLQKLPDNLRAVLEAKYQAAIGLPVAAAWCLAETDATCGEKQSYFFNADLIDQAVIWKKPGTRLANHISAAYHQRAQGPAFIAAKASQVNVLQAMHRGSR